MIPRNATCFGGLFAGLAKIVSRQKDQSENNKDDPEKVTAQSCCLGKNHGPNFNPLRLAARFAMGADKEGKCGYKQDRREYPPCNGYFHAVLLRQLAVVQLVYWNTT